MVRLLAKALTALARRIANTAARQLARQHTSRGVVCTAGVMGGRPRIAGRRVSVQDIAIWYEHMGRSVDEIAHEFQLSLTDVHEALAYYYSHQNEIAADIREDDMLAESLRATHPSKLKAKLSGRTDPMVHG